MTRAFRAAVISDTLFTPATLPREMMLPLLNALRDPVIDIKERAVKAIEEQVETAGAGHGGETASFLKEEEEAATGASLIDALEHDSDEPQRSVETVRASPEVDTAADSRDEVLEDLLDDKPQAESRSKPSTEVPDKPSGVDSSMIDGLLGDDDAKESGS